MNPEDRKLLAMLASVPDRPVRVRCARCDRVLGDVWAPSRHWWAYIDHVGDDARSRPHIARGFAGRRIPGGVPENEVTGTLLWKCKCGADIQRNRVGLVPAFVRAALAGSPLIL
jgi:hypothetical protein